MKHLHKFASVLLALAMALSLMVPAFATNQGNTAVNEEKATITVPSGHVYEIYQIFTGTVSTKTEGTGEDAKTVDVLSDVMWGQNAKVPDSMVSTELVPVSVLTELQAATGSDQEKLAVIEKYVDQTGPAYKIIAKGETSVEVDPGYYLIVDRGVDGNGTAGEDEDETLSLNIVEIVKSLTITPKTSNLPTPDKQVQEDSTGAWGDSADFDMNQVIPYKLTAELPSNMTERYKNYKLNFVDELSAGLDLVSVEGIVVADNSDLTGIIKVTIENVAEDTAVPSYTATYENHVLTVKFADVISLGDSAKIVVEYNAMLNANAVVGNGENPGNPNSMKLEYFRDPNADQSGDTNPPDETPEEKVVVFTYELDGDKFDATNAETKLAGAKFKLHKGTETDNNVQWAVVTDGKITGWTTDKDEASELTTDENGKFSFIGLDADTYYLEETEAPVGYNKLTYELKVVITATTSLEGVTSLKATVTPNTENGTVTDVEGNVTTGSVTSGIANAQGATLPETGGIGTTIFYVVGGLLTVGAVILLVTKKRMSADSDK